MKNNDIYKLAIVFCFFFLFLSCNNKKEDENIESLTGKTIMETGELDAVNAKAFVMPYFMYFYEMRVIGLLEHGSIVHPGDSIIQFDPTEVNKLIVTLETTLETQLAALEKLQVDQANATNELTSNYKTAQATFNLKKIALEISSFESERYKRIKELEFEQEKISLAKEERKIELNEIMNDNNMKIQEIRINQIKSQIKSFNDIKNSLTIRTQYEGIFQIANNGRTGAMIKIGDNIYAGNPLAKVPELENMKVNTFINENDFLKIYPGQQVSVRLDALPNVSFDGEISYIGKLCYLKDRNSRQKVFDVGVNILKPDERLKPGMTVSCEYLNCK